MSTIYSTVEARFWRMLSVRWQREPLSGAGAAITGGRWNRSGRPALYLSADHSTAIHEFHQGLVRPGTLTPYDVRSAAIVDLTSVAVRRTLDIADAEMIADWRAIVAIERATPPGWRLADRLVDDGTHGILVPSAQNPVGINLVLWLWSKGGDDGARVTPIDPNGDLRR